MSSNHAQGRCAAHERGPEEFDMDARDADVVVIGFGGAGAAAAIAAADAGASVLILEKLDRGGGATRFSGGSMRTYVDERAAVDHIEVLCEGTTDRRVIEAFVRESGLNLEWVKQLGGELGPRSAAIASRFPVIHNLASFTHLPGAEGIGPRRLVKGDRGFGGANLWALLEHNASLRGIDALYGCAAGKLIRSSDGVNGVIAEQDGRRLHIRARRGVVLCCGGFEFDSSLQMNFLGQRFYGLAGTGNTGDGIRMAADVGADLWHMSAVAMSFGYKVPEFEFAIRHSMPAAGYLYVDRTGTRFVDEGGTDAHLMWSPVATIDTKTLERTRVPAYVIFDETTRLRGAVGYTDHGSVCEAYHWSDDNGEEIRKGWITAADSVGELARRIGLPVDKVQATVDEYNRFCASGTDPQYGREAKTLVPLAAPPFYAAEMRPCLFNTQGGPRRNHRAQIMDVWGQPIPRLYGAGELGSIWHRNYPGAGNVSEALAFGRIAGAAAAAEVPLTG